MARPSTFSIVAVDPANGEIGVGVQSKFLSVGAVVPGVRAGAGAIATQAWANTTFGPRGLAALAEGLTPSAALDSVLAGDEQRDDRQVGIADATGQVATFTGSRCIAWAGGRTGKEYTVQGNCLAGAAVIDAMANGFERAPGPLADRMVAALRAGQAAGGDRRGQQSAALLIEKPGGGYGGFNDRYVDLRVDDHPSPIEALARLLELHKLYFFEAAPGDLLKIDYPLGARLAALLVRAGRLPRPDQRAFDDVAERALVAFMHEENLENRVRSDRTIDRQTLDYLMAYVARRETSH